MGHLPVVIVDACTQRKCRIARRPAIRIPAGTVFIRRGVAARILDLQRRKEKDVIIPTQQQTGDHSVAPWCAPDAHAWDVQGSVNMR